ncbi:MAG: MFS transporter, partial [Armatimonadetes bacterium]|nr:MFS transporter [Armatimonadota bacterium]
HSATNLIVMFGSGPIAVRLGRSSVIIPGMLFAALAMFVLWGAQNQLVFLGAAFFSGLGFGLIQPGMQSLVIDRVKPSERGAAVATLQSAWDIGGSGGALALGPVAGVVGAAATFGIVGVGALAGTAGFIVGIVRNPISKPAEQIVRTSEANNDD